MRAYRFGTDPCPLPLARWVVCAIAGALQGLSAGWTASSWPQDGIGFDLPWLTTGSWALQLAAAGLFAACLMCRSERPTRDTVLLSGAFGLTWQCFGTWWLFIGMHTYAGLSAALAALAVLALGIYLTLYSVLASLAFRAVHDALQRQRRTVSATHIMGSASAFAGAWVLAEMGRAIVMTGFPWASSGYAHLQGPFRVLLPWLGVYGTAAVAAGLVALAAGAVVTISARALSRITAAAAAAGALVLLHGAPERDFTQPAGEFEVSLLQGNVSQDTKFREDHVARALNWYTFELSRSFADIAMAPETALPVLPEQVPREYWSRIERRVQSQPGLVIVGLPHAIGSEQHTNTLVALGHAQTWVEPPPDGIYRHHKRHLVPFAEFTPWGFGWFTRLLNLPLPSFETTQDASVPIRFRSRSGQVHTIAPLICFEDLFAEDFAPLFRDSDAAPTAMANASNLAWFDRAPAMAQHLRFAQARSLEFQRPTFRATNTGPTVVINHQGRVTRALPPLTVGVLSAVVEGRTGITPYAFWLSRLGLWPLVAAGMLLILLPFLASRR